MASIQSGDLTDGGNISGSHSNTLTVTNVSLPDAADYYVTVTDNAGSVDSATATLTVIEPIIVSQPVSVTNLAGSTVSFTVGAQGTAPVNYIWGKNGTPLSDGTTSPARPPMC